MPQNSSQGTKSQNFLGGLTGPQTPSCIWLASLAVAGGNFGPVN